jgi:protein-disulfide isomerase
MTSNRPAPTNKNVAPPPTSRRSARQRRLASREANRAMARAGSTGATGGGMRSLMLWTGIAVAVGIVVIGGALFLTQGPATGGAPSLMPPSVITPTNVPTTGRTLGDPNAKVTIDVYEDFRCTGCFAFRTEIEPTIETNYIQNGKAKIVYHDFITIDRTTTESRDAANAALCAADQNKFWPMHDWLFANQSPRELNGYFTIDRLVQLGRQVGLNMSVYEPCVRQGLHNAEVQSEQGAAPSSVQSTPSIFVNGVLVTNPDNAQAIPNADQIGAAIDKVLNPSASPSASAAPSAS